MNKTKTTLKILGLICFGAGALGISSFAVGSCSVTLLPIGLLLYFVPDLL
jgi:hypothetical protein